MYNTLWYLGSIVAAWTVFGTMGYSGNMAWKIPVGLQGLMPGIQLIGKSGRGQVSVIQLLTT